jgi:hypothetical protein
MSDLPADIKAPVRSFSFNEEIESFVVRNPADGSEIAFPRVEQIRKHHFQDNTFSTLPDGTKMSVMGDGGGLWSDHTFTMSNREAGWTAHVQKTSRNMMGKNGSEGQKSGVLYFISPETYTINLFDFKENTQYTFEGSVLDHPNIERGVWIGAEEVTAEPLTGTYIGYNFMDPDTIKFVEEKFMADFEKKSEKSLALTKSAIYAATWDDYSGSAFGDPDRGIIISRGDVLNQDALLTFSFYDFNSSVDWVYGDPQNVVQFHGHDKNDLPVFESDRVSLYRTMGGVVVEDRIAKEHYYILDEAKAYMRVREDFAANSGVQKFDICDLGGYVHKNGNYLARYALTSDGDIGCSKWKEIPTIAEAALDLSNHNSLETIFKMANEGRLPKGDASLYPEGKSVTVTDKSDVLMVSEVVLYAPKISGMN